MHSLYLMCPDEDYSTVVETLAMKVWSYLVGMNNLVIVNQCQPNDQITDTHSRFVKPDSRSMCFAGRWQHHSQNGKLLPWFGLSYMRPSIQLLLKCLLVEGGTVGVQQFGTSLTEWWQRKWRQSLPQTQTVPSHPYFCWVSSMCLHLMSAHHSQLAMQAITKNGTRKHEIKLLAESFMLPLAMWQR